MTAVTFLRRRLRQRGQTLLPLLAVLSAAAALSNRADEKAPRRGAFFYSHFLCRKNHSSPATSNTLAAMMAG